MPKLMEKKKKKKSQMNESFYHSLSISLCGWARGHQEWVQLVKRYTAAEGGCGLG